MDYFAGLDVSLEMTSICIVDADGVVMKEVKVASEPDDLVGFFAQCGMAMKRIGLEAGAPSQWLCGGMAEAGLPVVCIETRHAKAALSAMPNKTDRNDARGIANIMRTGWFRAVHVKTQTAQELRFLLVARQTLVRKLMDIELAIRGMLRSFGLKMGVVSKRNFEARVLELAGDRTMLMRALNPMLTARRALALEYANLQKVAMDFARDDDVCRRLMTVPGVGPIVALTYRATIDVPSRFRRSKSVGAHLGLTPRAYQSGEVDWNGRVSKSGDAMARAALYEAAHILLTRVKRWSSLKAWGMRLVKNRGHKRAVTALARRMSVLMHRIWVEGTVFIWKTGDGQVAAPAAVVGA
ncbi:IS110 family transposase [Brucella pseudintermedia]|uniref:IS110 family transposase n=1 Tax=Brucella pseudintermedia TaxID=370111 RepID=A0ABY5UEA7_9HYPH|nr:IS110 family transposase [Brucella pseudintermedia]UWL61669.1 IS110 family transposase [Brucella pseudintermedia]